MLPSDTADPIVQRTAPAVHSLLWQLLQAALSISTDVYHTSTASHKGSSRPVPSRLVNTQWNTLFTHLCATAYCLQMCTTRVQPATKEALVLFFQDWLIPSETHSLPSLCYSVLSTDVYHISIMRKRMQEALPVISVAAANSIHLCATDYSTVEPLYKGHSEIRTPL